MKVLIVEDEPALRAALVEYLTQDGFRCEQAAGYAAAHEKVKLYEYDAVLLDLTLPDGRGLDLLRTLKADRSAAGVLILTARDALADKLAGLELGADDYLTKPFHLAEVSARLRAVLRRRHFEGQPKVEFAGIVVDLATTAVTVHGQPVILTRKQYELLLYFLAHPGRVLTKEALAEHAWGDGVDAVDSFDFIYTHLKNLRQKLQEAGGGQYLRTVYGLGYQLLDPDA
ncbi:response regulator transcription factor [Hymenobacter lucidus]|uniref:Response regulator transcription factor n=1 Tax=Hymenobacter lucidus TaxID=2880930 RepID=A0ABS8AY42_9BACT|nr:response regulator transcription factor [Hymenobacter lucidus]MCB2410699.1 response regulator transcription factor [Hymenobacter lucidus]